MTNKPDVDDAILDALYKRLAGARGLSKEQVRQIIIDPQPYRGTGLDILNTIYQDYFKRKQPQ